MAEPREVRQQSLEAARIEAKRVADMLASHQRAYLLKAERSRTIHALRWLSQIACSATCDAEQGWLEGYAQGRDDERNGVE